VLPTASQSFQWRLADLDSVRFDDAAYEVVLECGSDRLRVSKLAKRTEEFATRVQDALSSVATQSVQALHSAFPFLNPDQLRESASLLREGRSAIVANLDAIHPKFSTALASNAVDQNLKPYFDELIGRTAKDQLHAGFKLIRAEDGEELAADETADESGDDVSTALDADKTGPPTLYWFFFPIARRPGSSEVANLVAWEASSASGRATYFFRLIDPARVNDLRDAHVSEAAVRRLNRVLGMLNFHRRPIYLSDDELALDPKFRRYAIAARRMPEVREVRANFLGRAIHSSVDAWKDQFDAILKKSAD